MASLTMAVALISFTNAHLVKPAKTSTVTFNDQSSFEIDGDLWNDCTAEWVHVTGQIHFTVQGMINNNRISMVQHGNCQGLSGVGLSSRKHYAGSDVFNGVYNANFTGSYTTLAMSSVRLQAPGAGNNLVVVVRMKTTVNANGDVTVDHMDDAMFCQ